MKHILKTSFSAPEGLLEKATNSMTQLYKHSGVRQQLRVALKRVREK